MTKGMGCEDTPSHPDGSTFVGIEIPIDLFRYRMGLRTNHACSFPETVDTPLERFGLQVRCRRRQAGFAAWEFAARIDIEFDLMAALEFGFASFEDVENNIPKIANGLELPESVFWKFLEFLCHDVSS
jgi:hypothetical protein